MVGDEEVRRLYSAKPVGLRTLALFIDTQVTTPLTLTFLRLSSFTMAFSIFAFESPLTQMLPATSLNSNPQTEHHSCCRVKGA